MFATSPHTFLAGCGAGIVAVFNTGKYIFELHHAGIGEH